MLPLPYPSPENISSFTWFYIFGVHLFLQSYKRTLNNIDTFFLSSTSGFITTHVVVYLWVCKTSYHLLISPPNTNLLNYLPAPYHSPSIPVKDSHWRETLIKLTARVECGASIHAIFQLTVRRIRMAFSLKPSFSQGE